MNCSMCQEKLDERLDQLRARVQDGTVSRAEARSLGMVALQEVAGQCAKCEAQLREHLNVRMAFLSAEPESVDVPPALRANVRRALERENAARSNFPARRPWTSYAWTSGALLSALGLFLIARPMLIQKAQESPTISSNQAPDVTQDQGAGVVPTTIPTKAPAARQRARSPQSGKSMMPKSSGAAVVLPTPQIQQQPGIVAAPSRSSQPPAKAVVPVPPEVPSAPIPQKSSSGQADAVPASPKKSASGVLPFRQNQLFSAPSLTVPTPQAPGAASESTSTAIAPSEKTQSGQPRLNAPVEQQLDKGVLAPSGEKLGLVVRFSAPPRAAFGAMRAQSGAMSGGVGGFGGGGFGGNNFRGGFEGGAVTSPQMDADGQKTLVVPVAPKPKVPLLGDTPLVGALIAPTPSSSEQRVTALENRIAAPPKPSSSGNTMKSAVTPPMVAINPTNNAIPDTALKAPQAIVGGAMSKADLGTAYSRLGANAAFLPSNVLLSVASPVIGARIQGRVIGKNEEHVLLWMGDLTANQPVAVSLVPLKVVSGDTIEISVEQQVSLGQSRKLATTSVVMP